MAGKEKTPLEIDAERAEEEAKRLEVEAKKKADLKAKEDAEIAAFKASVVGRYIEEHLRVLMDRTGGRHRYGE